MFTFSPDRCHEEILRTQKPLLAFDPSKDYSAWKEQVKERFAALLGAVPRAVDLNVRVEWQTETDTYTETRFIFDTEENASVPCHLLVPKTGGEKHPLVICLQGHSTGMHISLGRPLYDGDEAAIRNDADYGRQALEMGYAVLTVEQRGFGERVCARDKFLWKNTTCEHPAMVALLMGRTLLRERAWDISRAIDALAQFPAVDTGRIAIMGNSGGGTASYYTACLEPRIKAVMPSCSVCSFDRSIAMRKHCVCNYIPGMAQYFDMGEMACMIAPRPLLVVAGNVDDGFRIDGVRKVYKVIEEIYKKEGAPENCKLLVGEGGHKFYPEIAWKPFRAVFPEK